MEHKTLVEAGGIMLMIAGVMSLVYWIMGFVGLFQAVSFLPTYQTLIAAQILVTIENIFMTVCTIIFSVALILVGITVFLLPDMGIGGDVDKMEIEERINRLQNIVWKVLQKVKENK